MKNDWQTWMALMVVAATAVIMAYRVLVKKKTGCGEGCGCGTLKPKIGGVWKKSAAKPHHSP